MAVNLNPYLNFDGDAVKAMDLYHSVFGGELSRMTFGENGMGGPDDAAKIMHSQLEIAPGMTLMAADVPAEMATGPVHNGSISLSGGPAEADALRSHFAALSGSGTVTVPLEKAPWGDSFGMCVDAVGVSWMVNIAGA